MNFQLSSNCCWLYLLCFFYQLEFQLLNGLAQRETTTLWSWSCWGPASRICLTFVQGNSALRQFCSWQIRWWVSCVVTFCFYWDFKSSCFTVYRFFLLLDLVIMLLCVNARAWPDRYFPPYKYKSKNEMWIWGTDSLPPGEDPINFPIHWKSRRNNEFWAPFWRKVENLATKRERKLIPFLRGRDMECTRAQTVLYVSWLS